eukprot:TRINITY_DN54943_c0_g1_i1.p1 TRINITY_DN54943_c0_g1~~TRINITY_DN54943_c0_g1_i1.p1  ORF type:complete len:542 (+),score=141.48 TRINITY_DN54943_c0_g1_i1:66-1691(+)
MAARAASTPAESAGRAAAAAAATPYWKQSKAKAEADAAEAARRKRERQAIQAAKEAAAREAAAREAAEREASQVRELEDDLATLEDENRRLKEQVEQLSQAQQHFGGLGSRASSSAPKWVHCFNPAERSSGSPPTRSFPGLGRQRGPSPESLRVGSGSPRSLPSSPSSAGSFGAPAFASARRASHSASAPGSARRGSFSASTPASARRGTSVPNSARTLPASSPSSPLSRGRPRTQRLLDTEQRIEVAKRTANVKRIGALLLECPLNGEDDQHDWLRNCDDSLWGRLRREAVRRATSAQDLARCRIARATAQDWSNMPPSGQLAKRSQRLDAMRLALESSEEAIRLAREARLGGIQQLQMSVVELRDMMQHEAACGLEAATRQGGEGQLRAALEEARRCDVPLDSRAYADAVRLMQRFEAAADNKLGHLDASERALYRLKDHVESKKMKPALYFRRFYAAKGSQCAVNLRTVLSDAGVALPSAVELQVLLRHLEGDVDGMVPLKLLCTALSAVDKKARGNSESAASSTATTTAPLSEADFC